MKKIDELLEALNSYGEGPPYEAILAIRAQQAEIERLKGEYARGIEDAARIVHLMYADRVERSTVIDKIRALLPKQKELK